MEMETRQTQQTLFHWSGGEYGLCEAVFQDGVLRKFMCGQVNTTDINYLRLLHKILGELLSVIVDSTEESQKPNV